jgi:urocanate hydratase
MSGPRSIRAPRGTQLTCKSWPAEVSCRMPQNNLEYVLTSDAGIGVERPIDTGYKKAVETAQCMGIQISMSKKD